MVIALFLLAQIGCNGQMIDNDTKYFYRKYRKYLIVYNFSSQFYN